MREVKSRPRLVITQIERLVIHISVEPNEPSRSRIHNRLLFNGSSVGFPLYMNSQIRKKGQARLLSRLWPVTYPTPVTLLKIRLSDGTGVLIASHEIAYDQLVEWAHERYRRRTLPTKA